MGTSPSRPTPPAALGTPQAHTKLWRSFSRSSALNALRMRECLEPGIRLRAALDRRHRSAPTHVRAGNVSVACAPVRHGGPRSTPLFPADIAAALEEVPEPRVLVTTPVHMRAIVASGQKFPRVALVLSATAPLDAASREAGRRPARYDAAGDVRVRPRPASLPPAARRPSSRGTFYPEVLLEPDAEGVNVNAPWFAAPMRLQDVIERLPGNRFTVLGRNSDMVDVAGKRASLADLTRRLMAIPGVKDAVVFQPDAAGSGIVKRVAASRCCARSHAGSDHRAACP